MPTNATWSNLRTVVTDPGFASALRMSLMITLLTVVLVLAFAFLAALAISRFRFRGRKSFVLAVLFIQMLPAEGLFIAQYKMLSSVGESVPALGLNSLLGVTVLYTAAVLPFTIWMLRGFVAGVPAELEEAAMVDDLASDPARDRCTRDGPWLRGAGCPHSTRPPPTDLANGLAGHRCERNHDP